MNNLYKIASVFRQISESPNESLDGALLRHTGLSESSSTGINAKFLVLGLFDDCLDEISHLGLPENRISAMSERLAGAKAQFLRSVNSNSTDEFRKHFQIEANIQTLESLGDTIAVTNQFGGAPLDRKDFSLRTLEQIEIIRRSTLDQYSKDSLILKLNAINRVVNECAYMTDDQIRLRVKAIVADFHSSFSKHDKNYESTSETLTRWAKQIMRPGVFALAITADITSVAGLLEGPKDG